jgi:HAE1 family hydrophobic/amphiphilic exporter-1
VNLARFGVTKPVPVNILMAVFLIAGVASGLNMTREFFPETEPERATVSLPYPGATPEEIEESMARKVEDAIADLDEVEKLTTTISEGGGGISVEFRDGIDSVTRATDEVERVIDALTDLPDEAEEIQVAEFEPTLPTIMVNLYGDADEETLKRAIRRIEDDLRSLPNMGETIISGVRDYEIRIDVDAGMLLEHRISLPEVANRIRAWMRDVPGGTVRTDVGNINVRAMGVKERAEAIRQIVVKATPDGQSLRVGDIATVRETFTDDQIRTRFRTREHSGESASITVYKVGDQDAVHIAEMVRSYVRGRQKAAGYAEAEFEPKWNDRLFAVLNWFSAQGAKEGATAPKLLMSDRHRAYELGLNSAAPLPSNCRIATNSDLARFIEGRLDLLTRNAKWGALLVFATLLMFLNWRAALWVGVGLATALAGTLLFMSSFGITLNLLTMFGLIVVLGLLVDDAIVVAENIMARHARKEPALEAAIRGTDQVFWPVVATVLTTIVAFLPLLFIKGQIGDLLGALPWVVACALTMSLIEAVLILPSHMGHSLVRQDRRRAGRRKNWVDRFEGWRDRMILERLVPAYASLLRLLLKFRYVSLALAIATLVMTLGLVAGGRAGFTFLASSDSETLIVELKMPIGTPIEVTEQYVQRVEDAAAAQPEMKSISTLVGVTAAIDDTSGIGLGNLGTHFGQIFIELLPVEQRDRESASIIDSIREQLRGKLEGAESIAFSEIQGGPGGQDITIQVSGNDDEVVLDVVDEVKALLAELEGVYDIADDYSAGQREVQIELDPDAEALGFDIANVAEQFRGALFGLDAHVFSANREDIDVRVRLDEQTRRNLFAIENLWVISPTGARVPLSEIATVTEGNSYNTIRRIDRKRTTTVTADTAQDVNPEAIIPQIEPTLRQFERDHPGIAIEFGGRQRQFSKAFASLPIGFGAAVMLIYVILAWLFSSYVQPLAVMTAIPFGTIGVVWGHLLLGYEMTFLSLIGFVALSGIVVNDSLIFVKFYNEKRAEGESIQAALIAAGRQRLRPIMLTTITTVLGLTPLMLEQSFQAKFLIPMAISVAFGLMGATILILLVLPCLIVIIDDINAVAFLLWNGRPRAADRPLFSAVPEVESD